ncbi:CPBP family intramembrane glutamic endopeptidase [Microbacterium paludicola]|uniref:CPBP family intramembrane glutamic endopeptidase n=1 Tax=Microbacterium paludicola TaxID=300019 RepID=UPI0031D50BA3
MAVMLERAADVAVMVLLWAALLLAVSAACGAIANSLPGVTPFESPRVLVGAGLLAVCFAAMAVLPLYARTPRSLGRSDEVRWMLDRGRHLTVRLLRDVLGLAMISWRRLLVALVAGVAGGLVSVAIGGALLLVPALAESVPASDARFDAVAGTAPWVPPAFFAIYAAAPEEIIYRGVLLGALALSVETIRSRWARVVVASGALLIVSAVFGQVHLDWSLLNAVTAGVTGAVYGIVAIATRSLWAAIIAHMLYNALIFVV